MKRHGNGLMALCVLCVVAVILIGVSPGFGVMKDGDDKGSPESQNEYMPDEVIVKFKPEMKEAEKEALKDKVGVRTVKKHGITGSELLKIKNKDKKVKDIIQKLKKDPGVEYAEPNYIVRTQAVVNDPMFGELWGIHNTGQPIKGIAGAVDVDIDGPEAWDNEVGSPEIVVGVIDTGLDISHPDLADNIWTNPGEIAGDGVDNDGNGYIDDLHGWDFYNDHPSVFESGDHFHATHVAGTIAGIANNGIGVAGVAPRVKIMPIQFLGPDGSGTISDAIDAVGYAKLMGIKITNNSWGGGGFSQALYDAIVNWGGVFVAAAGNSSSNADLSPMYPAAYNCSNILSVAAINNQGGLAWFSNYGATTVDVGAPGLDVFSTLPGNSYGYLSGTSMATPHAAGIAALILSRAPAQTPQAVIELIKESAAPLASLQGKTLSGGMAKAHAALMKLDVRSTDPLDGAIEVPVSKTITVTYNFEVQPGTDFGAITLKSGDLAMQIVSQVSGSVLILDPVADLENNKSYTVFIPAGAIHKADGTPLASYTFGFKTPDTIAPTIISTDPADGSETVVGTKTIMVTISEKVVRGSNFGLITLKADAAVVQAAINLSGGILTIDPVFNLGNNTRYTVTIPDNAITDPTGNMLAADTFNFTTLPDAQPPTVQGSDPANNATWVAVDKIITVTFSEQIAGGTNFSGIIISSGSATVPTTLSISGNILSIDPVSDLSGDTGFTVTVPAGAVKDSIGNPLEAGYSFGFTTADIVPPAVRSTNPANGATNIPVGTTISVSLSEDTSKGPNFSVISLKDEAGTTVPAAVYYNSGSDEYEGDWTDTRTIMIDPVADLARGRSYTVTIPADSVRDAGGLPNQAYSFSFRTPFSVILTDPANNATKVAVDKTITVTLSEAGVQGPNFSNITLKAGATTIQSAISINANVLTIDPAANLGNDTTYMVSIPADSIRNAAGVSVNAYTFSFRTPDITPPGVIATNPANNATNVAIGTTITVSLTEETSAGPGFSAVTLKDEAGNAVPAAVYYNGGSDDEGDWTDTRTIVINPIADLTAGKVYTATIPADSVRDKDANPNSQYSFHFSTPFTVTGTSPANNATRVPVDQTITVTLSETGVQGPNFNGITFKAGATTIPSAVSINANVLTIDPAANLNNDTVYAVMIPGDAIRNAAGVSVSPYTFSFRTPDITPPGVIATNPANNATNVAIGTTITVSLTEETSAGANFSAINLKDEAGNNVAAAVYYNGGSDDEGDWTDTRTIVINPVADLAAGKVYTATIPADSVRDKDANPNSQYGFHFSTPFTVTGTSPANNATKVPVDQTIMVTLSGSGVQGPSFSSITLKAGATTIQSGISINENVLTIDPAANLNNDTMYTVTIPADSIRNAVGVPVNAYIFSFRTPDITPPGVIATNPANNATNVAIGTTITVSLSEETSAGPNFSAITLKDETGNTVPAAVYYNAGSDDEGDWTDTRTIVINPVADLTAGKVYTATIPADSVRDKDANPNAQYSFRFSTPFTVTGTSPANNATRVPVDQTITVTLSGSGVQGPSFSSITLKAGATTIQSGISINENILTIDPAANLNNDTMYTVTIPADSIRNAVGVPVNAYIFSFRTPDITPPAVSNTNPANNGTDVAVGTTIIVSLTEETSAGPGFSAVTLKDEAGNAVPAAVYYNAGSDDEGDWTDTRTIMINPTADLAGSSVYTVTIPADTVRDKDANPNSEYSFSFSTPFTVTGTSPENDATRVPVDQLIIVTLSGKGVQGPAFDSISLKAGAATVQSSVSINGNVLTIDPTTNLDYDTTYTVEIPADSIRNAAGKPVKVYIFRFTTPFAVTATNPADNAIKVPVDQTITATLSSNGVEGPAFSSITLKAGTTTIQSAISLNGKILTIDPTANLAINTTYTVTIPEDSIRNTKGVPVNAYTFSFKAGDNTPPAISASYPANNATNVAIGTTITVSLSEETSAGPNFSAITLKDETGNTVPAAVYYNAGSDDEGDWTDTRTIVINPVADLTAGKVYTVTIPADSVRDNDANPNAQYSFRFSTPFTVTATSPANNATRVPVDQTITVTLSGSGVQGPSFSSITLKAGATTIQSAISINANMLTIDPAANLNNDTVYAVTIPADSIRNAAGVPVNAYIFSFRTPDITPPGVIATNPANNASNVAIGTTITVSLSEETSAGPNFSAITLKDEAGNAVPAAVYYNSGSDDEGDWTDTRTIVIDPVADLTAGKIYIATIPADSVRDKDGNPNAQYSFRFSTPFIVTATSPAANATKVPVDQTITVTLSEAGVQGPNFSSITLKAGATTVQSAVSINENVLTIDPAANLGNDTSYTVNIPADAIRNAAGVSVKSYIFSFRTQDIVAPSVIATNPANNATNVAIGTTVVVSLTEETSAGPNFSVITLKDEAGNAVPVAVYYNSGSDDEGDWTDTRTIMIDPVADLVAGRVYIATIPADSVRDKDGNPNAQYSFRFSTPFIVTATSPAANATKIPVDQTITVTLSEAGVQGPNFSSITLKAGATTVQSAVSINENVLTIDPAANLGNDTSYTVNIPADAIRNAAGVSVKSYIFSFRTQDIVPPSVIATNPANNATNVAVGTTVVVSLTEETSAGPSFSVISLKDEAGNAVPVAVYYNSGSDDEGDWTDTRTIMIDPVADLASGKLYTATIPADSVRDKDGNPNSQYSFHFSTPL